MMVRRLVVVIATSAVLVVGPGIAAMATEVPVVDLIDNGADFDGDVISVIGELIGDYGTRRGGETWTQLNQDRYVVDPIALGGAPDGPNIGIGVRMSTELITGLGPPGRYRQVGPIVVLTGVWRYHDPDRQGESYLDVSTIELIRNDRLLAEPPDWGALGVGTIMLAAGAFLLLSHRRARNRH
jgi:hypothetical protein